MRQLADADRIRRFMRAVGERVRASTRVYFTGGTTAVLLGWRPTTVDIDLKAVPECDDLFRAIVPLKESLQINVEVACPSDFIPPLPTWEDRSEFIAIEGKVQFFHYDFYAQCLSKIERGHTQDLADVKEMLDRGLVKRERLLALFEAIEPQLYRYPALDPTTFRQAVAAATLS